MVPEAGRFLVVGVVVVLGGKERAGLAPVFCEPGLGIPVAVGPNIGAVQVHHGAHMRFSQIGAVDRGVVGVIEEMSLREVVRPTAPSPDGPFVSPM